jgi:hypothetical protein
LALKPIGIRKKIEASPGFMGMLGTFTPPGKSPVPGLYVIKNIKTDPPRDWKPSGLILYIHNAPRRSPSARFGGVADLYQWEMELIQYDRSKDCETAKDELMCMFQRIRIISESPQDEDTLEQVKIAVPGQQLFDVK